MVALLERGLYRADGQIEDEVYEYGSFRQSKMFAKGVTCSDCHEPHSLALRASGDAVCLQCHAAVKYETAEHSFHQKVSLPPTCISCHMPADLHGGSLPARSRLSRAATGSLRQHGDTKRL